MTGKFLPLSSRYPRLHLELGRNFRISSKILLKAAGGFVGFIFVLFVNDHFIDLDGLNFNTVKGCIEKSHWFCFRMCFYPPLTES